MYKSISIDEFYQKQKNEELTILDVREIYEFKNGHILNSKNIPLSNIDQAYKNLDKTKPYFVICHSGSRSINACIFLSNNGFDVTNVMGGMSSWKGDVVI
ncbi:rhodanese-like domain-containing protein [Enterococcus raffinosus]|uniref:rhodanese-like domain-containing protein n=1 Tax=Enterococcus raffinosus TaxID=71452 RepID=UPI001C1026D0|nr:rhodanese-like domain-containing protein [Enterococcus raffinosus]MBU5362846.1 rhodanese-like domain-containing protein [Enterococcus raffinosus]